MVLGSRGAGWIFCIMLFSSAPGLSESLLEYSQNEDKTILVTKGIPYQNDLILRSKMEIRIAKMVGGIMIPEKGSSVAMGATDAVGVTWVFTQPNVSLQYSGFAIESSDAGAMLE